MGIVDDDVVRVREATDLAALVGEHVGLKRVGRRLVGLCPFHAEKTPSFSVNPELGFFHCFGCQVSGDAITFVREIEHLDFVGAVERLAARAGITLRYTDQRGKGERDRRTRLVEAVGAAADFYHRRLLDAPDAGPARAYVRHRGLDGDVVRQFSIGWAPEGWDELSRHLQHQKFSRQDLVEAGLAFVNRANRLQDQFRGRVMFPIFDVNGDPVAFGGRTLGEAGPKYTNSPETAIYRKRRVLYGLNWAKAGIVAAGEAVLCEGYTDVIACFLAGAPRAVATCGTALADDHVRLLKRFASRLVLAYDADAAGQAAAERFYEWETEHELTLAVAALEPGRDPADTWRDDPALLRKALEQARPFLQFRLERVLARADRSTPEGRARAAEGAVLLIAEHPSELVRDQYTVGLADELGIDLGRLRDAVARARAGGQTGARRAPAPEDVTRPAPPLDRREVEALRLSVHHPELVPHWLTEEQFAVPVVRAAFAALAASQTLQDAIDAAPEDARSLLRRVAVEELEAVESMEAHAASVVVNLVEAASARHLRVLVNAGDDAATEGTRLLDVLAQARAEGDWDTGLRAAEQLVTWGRRREE